MVRTKSYDPKSYYLAEHFLSDVDGATDGDRLELAQAIQDVCEEHCRDVEQRVARYMDPSGAHELKRAEND